MTAGLTTLDLVSKAGFYEHLFAVTQQLTDGLESIAKQYGIPFTTNHVGSMFGLFFTEEEKVTRYEQVMSGNNDRFNQFFHGMLVQGVYLAPASYEAGFVSGAHTSDIIDATLTAAEIVMRKL